MDRHALKIYLLETDNTQYGVLNHFSRSFGEALRRQGVDVSFFRGAPPPLEEAPPDLTLSFFPFDAIIGGKRLWDYFKIPHFFYSVDALDYFSHLLESPYFSMSVRDRASLRQVPEKYRSKVLFLPHAAELNREPDYTAPRPIEISFLGSCTVPESDEIYLTPFPEVVKLAYRKARALYEEDNPLSCYEAFQKARLDYPEITDSLLASLDFSYLMQALDMSIRNRQRLKLLRAIKNIPIHLYGNQLSDKTWQEALEGQKNIVYHPAVPFDEALNIMSQTKILLNTGAAAKEAAHERIFYAYQTGTLPVTLKHPYVAECFTDESSILFYSPGQEDKLEQKIQRYLADEPLRLAAVKKGREIVLKSHTWDERAKTFLAWWYNNSTLQR